MINPVQQLLNELFLLHLGVREYAAFSKKIDTWAKKAALVLVLIGVGRRFRYLFFLVAAVTIVDDRTDKRRPIGFGMSAREYLARTDRLITQIAQSRKLAFIKSGLPEHRLLNGAAIYFARHGFPEFGSEMLQIWRSFEEDAVRVANGECFPAAQALEKAREANEGFIILCLCCLGIVRNRAKVFARQVAHQFIRGDVLADLQDDICYGTMLVTRQEMEANGVDADELLEAKVWERIFNVSGVRSWYGRELCLLEQKWKRDEAEMIQDLKEMLASGIAFHIIKYFILGKHIENLKKARHFFEEYK